MKTTLLNEHGGLRTFAVVLETGDETMRSIVAFAKKQQLRATHFSAIGAFSRVVVAYFDWETKEYRNIPIEEQVEVLSLIGDITLEDRQHKVHGHVVVGKRNATAYGGHLIEGHVRPTLEILMTETPTYLRRRFDVESGLALLAPGEPD